LSEEGIVIPIVAINRQSGRIESSPEIIARGLTTMDDAALQRARDIVFETIETSSPEERSDYGVMKEKIRGDLKRHIQKSTSRRPLIMPVILEI
jgi:ribonuclease J